MPNSTIRYEARGIKLVERKVFPQLGVDMYECTIGEKEKGHGAGAAGDGGSDADTESVGSSSTGGGK